MKLDLGAVARDTAIGVVRAWPWLVAAVLFRVACDWIEIWIDIFWTEADPRREGLRSDSLGAMILREILNGLVVGIVVAAVLNALGVLPGGRLARGLRAWPTAFATGLIWSLPYLTAASMSAAASMTASGMGFGDVAWAAVMLAAAITALTLSVLLSYATGSAVVRGTGVIASFRDSLRLTRSHRWKLLMISVGLMVFYSLAYYAGNRLGHEVRGPWVSFAVENGTLRSAGVLCFVVVAAVWANLDRIRPGEIPDGDGGDAALT
jgi:hypothetical protein